MTEQLTLKWGTLKGWKLNEDSPAFKKLGEYIDAGNVSMSAMMQHDTPEQQRILCELIDVLDAETVYLDWDGKDVSKEEAKNYIMDYRKS